MATIRPRKQADGSTRYTAIVRIRQGKTIVYQEYRTFALRTAAASWAKHREVALDDPSALVQVKQSATTVAELIRWYIETFQTISKRQRSKQAHLQVPGALCARQARRIRPRLPKRHESDQVVTPQEWPESPTQRFGI
jgi:hypothetical protein